MIHINERKCKEQDCGVYYFLFRKILYDSVNTISFLNIMFKKFYIRNTFKKRTFIPFNLHRQADFSCFFYDCIKMVGEIPFSVTFSITTLLAQTDSDGRDLLENVAVLSLMMLSCLS